jgi:TonB family protein
MLQLKPNSTGSNGQAAAYVHRQRRRMWIAMILLIGALGVVLVKDHQLWFNSADEVADEESAGSLSTETAKKPASVHRQAQRFEKRVSAASSETTVSQPGTSIIETARAAVRPLDVQVVTSNQARVVRGSSNMLQVEIPAYSGMWTTKWASTPSGTNLVATNAVQRVRMPSEGGDVPQDSSSASYPLLSKQMRVRGAVVLEALVGPDGNIEDLRVLSGPAVLASAAREALRQWKFKPYLENGRPVESQAKITVNFLISAS